ncbi:hypothetical protein KSS87_018891, partial [Heliosperma pusillum]
IHFHHCQAPVNEIYKSREYDLKILQDFTDNAVLGGLDVFQKLDLDVMQQKVKCNIYVVVTEMNCPQAVRHGNGNPALWNSKGDSSLHNSQDQNATELAAKAREQEHEVSLLRMQVAQAYIKEMQLLNEKYALERKFSDLRMAMDEKQKETISSDLKDLADRRSDLNEYVRLTNDLKVRRVRDGVSGVGWDYGDSVWMVWEMWFARVGFGRFWLNRVSEHGVWPGVTSASSISMYVKHVYDVLQWKTEEKTKELSSIQGIHTPNPYYVDSSVPSWVNFRPPYTPGRETGVPPSSDKANDHLPATNNEGPGIEGFQIIGEAKPGCKLLGCGYPIRGTSLCIFQWLRHLQDGTRHYIEDPEMQEEINSYVSRGQAHFIVLVLFGSLEQWETATFILHRSGFQIKNNETGAIQIAEKFSENLSIKIPGGLSAQFVVTCSDGTSHPFKIYNDLRMRDTIVLTIRMFQSRALDDRKKGKAHS